MKILMLVGLAMLHVALPTLAQEIKHIGDFHNVSLVDEGVHCSGYSLGIWEYKKRMFGLFDVHRGLCGDPPCGAVTEIKHDPRKGTLSFKSLVQDQTYIFKGNMKADMITGKVNGKNIRLQKERDVAGMQSDKDVNAWCGFWQDVPRCEGVKEMCESIKKSSTGPANMRLNLDTFSAG